MAKVITAARAVISIRAGFRWRTSAKTAAMAKITPAASGEVVFGSGELARSTVALLNGGRSEDRGGGGVAAGGRLLRWPPLLPWLPGLGRRGGWCRELPGLERLEEDRRR